MVDYPHRIQRVIALPGSLRRASYNRTLLQAASRIAPAGIHIEVYGALADVPLFDEELEAATSGGPQPVRHLRAAVAGADGLLIATPEYNQSLPGVLKNAIDWLSRPAPEEVLVAKPVAITGVSSGRSGTRLAQSALRQTLTATEALVMPAPMLFVGEATRLFDAEGELHDPATRESLSVLLHAFGLWMERVLPARPNLPEVV